MGVDECVEAVLALSSKDLGKFQTGVEDSSVRISCPRDARFPDQHPSIAIWKPI